ncbi:FAS1-like dehydratase domain-containing protein [Trujillonella endophytica]|uniref:3-methylfumaryl-CoA hydratase n=1 Tax=Trujillonella endophytica TaxID=673521 RepID=A0A1H8QS33_9ACTN|nr:MaoC family dehydratase N-terminal domain-containing protein [Trujillella endophytica]SEO57079.1 3-methylfumaryl-CoA hydratase [Trujillella endophytica]
MSDHDDDAAAADWTTWTGRSSTSTAHLHPDQANRMAVTLDRPPTFVAGQALPPAWHWLYFHDFVESSRLGPDGHPARGIVMPPVPLERRMWAAGDLRFHEPLRLGETATRVSTISDITAKSGRSGPLYFVTVEHELRVGDRLAVAETQKIVYRELTAETGGAAAPAPVDPEFSRTWQFASTALFRYSALTFNSHRIHYDVEYARDVEGYPGLVVHGPLLATLLADLAESQGDRLAALDYRARSPLFSPDAFTVNGRRAGTAATLWATSGSGSLAMEATATYRQEAQ